MTPQGLHCLTLLLTLRLSLETTMRLVLLSTAPLLALLFCLGSGERAAGEKEPAAAPDFGDGGKADDSVRRILLAGPKPARDIFEIRQRLLDHGGKLKAHLVVNGGHDNPARTKDRPIKFMCFATYSNATPGKAVEEDELFVGFFLGEDKDTLVVLPGFVELIAWDRTKRLYNFWELIGPDWHYRGDSSDVLDNVAKLNIGAAEPAFTFTRRSPTDQHPVLRCSGCHTLGGPIMKELEAPHNDWWRKERKLQLGPFKLRPGTEAANPAHVAATLFDEKKEATDAANLSEQVKKGIKRLIAARIGEPGGPGLKALLRSLFTTMEMNLVSDAVPFAERLKQQGSVELAQVFFLDARLAPGKQPIAVPAKLFREALMEVGSRFAPGETPGLQESHHAFLVPARSYIDNQVIDALLRQGVLDDELVTAVLAIDFTTPVFSRDRAGLIRYVPDRAKKADDLRRQLIAALEKAPAADKAASELLTNLTDPKRTAAFHREKAEAYLTACRKAGPSREVLVDWLKVAAQRRQEIRAAETAKHPDGPITEPGFRVIFPVTKDPPKPGELRLDPATGRAVRIAP
jgi:hypothetical protein